MKTSYIQAIHALLVKTSNGARHFRGIPLGFYTIDGVYSWYNWACNMHLLCHQNKWGEALSLWNSIRLGK